MKLTANSSTVGEFREVKTLLAAHRKRLQEQLEMYPLVVTFAEYRYVLENAKDYESLISDINEAIVQYTIHSEEHDMTHMLLQCEAGQHNYEARYDEKLSAHYKPQQKTDFWSSVTSEEVPFDRIYIHDICTQCGHTVKRD